MNLKSKLFSFAATSVLALSITTGIASAADSVDVSAELVKGSCSVSIDSVSGNFGTWKYDGAKNTYVKTGSTTATFTGTVIEATPGGKCEVFANFTGLKNGTTSIGRENFTGGITGIGSAKLPVGTTELSLGAVSGATYTGTLTLEQLPGNAQSGQPGTYQGTVSVRVGNAQ